MAITFSKRIFIVLQTAIGIQDDGIHVPYVAVIITGPPGRIGKDFGEFIFQPGDTLQTIKNNMEASAVALGNALFPGAGFAAADVKSPSYS